VILADDRLGTACAPAAKICMPAVRLLLRARSDSEPAEGLSNHLHLVDSPAAAALTACGAPSSNSFKRC
jgi:hypothetical protein